MIGRRKVIVGEVMHHCLKGLRREGATGKMFRKRWMDLGQKKLAYLG